MSTLGDSIIEILANGRPLKAKEIAYQLARATGFTNATASSVNSVLYGELRGLVQQDRQYRWSLAKHQVEYSSRETKDSVSKEKSLLLKLCGYYLDCLYADDMGDLSLFASSQYSREYVEIGTGPELSQGGGTAKEILQRAPELSSLIAAQGRDRHRTTLYYGYPVFVRWIKSKRSEWQGAKLEPLFVCRMENITEDGGTGWRLASEYPHLNLGVLRDYIGSPDERRHFIEELGLTEIEGEPPLLGEVVLKLSSLIPGLVWKEQIDPDNCQSEPSLSQVTETGFYNRGIIFKAQRSQYTAGLETELARLADTKESDCVSTALGHIVGYRTPTSAFSQTQENKELFEAVPLNDEQRAAVISGTTQPFTVITGPPGTGKSQVVTSILVNAALKGQRVLFASKNNKAVDVVYDRANGLADRPLLIRVGWDEQRKGKLLEFLGNLLASQATQADEQRMAELKNEYEKLVKKRYENQKQIDSLIELRNQVDVAEQKIEDARKILPARAFNALYKNAFDISGDCAEQCHLFLQKCIRLREGPFGQILRFLFGKTLINKANRLLAACSKYSEFLNVTIPQSINGLKEDESSAMAVSQLCEKIRLARDVSAYGKLLSKLSSTDSLPELSEIDYKLTELITDVGQQYIAAWTICLPARLDDVGRRSLSRYRAALMELSNTGLGHREIAKLFRQIETNFPKISEYLPCWCVANLSLRGRIPFVPGFFDVVIIDEASQCDIASALPLLFRAKKAVIIGDPNQLQHITTMSRAQDAELKRKHGLLELENLDFGYRENSLFALAQGFAGKESVIQLKDHHRSHADIIDFSNRHFYEGTLRIATDYRKLKRDGGKCGIKWFNVEGKVFRPSEGGAVNELEAKAVVAETLSLIRERRYTGTIGITTPFRAQANRIRDYLQNELDTGEHDRHEIIVDVVHKFQGDERDCVFFSPVVSDNTPDTAIWFLRSTGNLFNVAITRARAILNVIGDIEACGKCGVDYLAKFAQYCAARTTSTEVNACGGQFESPWEKVLYDALVKIGLHPIPQYVVNQYRLDLALKVGNNWLDIEVDGERYHREWNGELSRRDVIRNQRLAEQGWKPLRFWVYEIRDDLPKCVERVKHAIS